MREIMTASGGMLVLGILLMACGTDEGMIASQPSPIAESPTPPPSPTWGTPTTTPIVITPMPTSPGEPTPPDESLITPEPTPQPSDPFTLVRETDPGPPFTPQELVRNFELIVTGRVVEILPAQWTTPDGSRPENPWVSVPSEFIIITPVIVELDGPPVMNRVPPGLPIDLPGILASNRVVVAQWGGTVQRDDGTTDGMRTDGWSQHFQFGDHVLIALKSTREGRPALPQTPAGPGWTVGEKYEISEDGTAVTMADVGPVSLPIHELVAAIARAEQEVPPITPTTNPSTPTSTVSTPTATPSSIP
jgi:hypothetical protein